MTSNFSVVSAHSTDIGNVEVQQDDAVIVNSLFNSDICSLYGVFDGHGTYGDSCSRFVKTTLTQLIDSHKEALNQNIEKSLTQLFEMVNELLCEESTIDTYLSGSTAVLVMVLKNQLIVINLGDSRAVLAKETSRGLKAISLSEYIPFILCFCMIKNIDGICRVGTIHARIRLRSKGLRALVLVLSNSRLVMIFMDLFESSRAHCRTLDLQ
ncbi:hypothetical protein K7432_008333 [Basidiobolus ranarum]|uniref:PPM-type phosphatase domain-containing protein n=1 Tax=Basidiobolus ranarum TaxID=34480 RepID=A0ABR2VYS7_9FUNG